MFLTLRHADLRDGDASQGYDVYFSPKPDESEFPTVWLDLHVGGEHYQRCGDDERARSFRIRPDGSKVLHIRPRHSVRVTTREYIGLSNLRTGIVMNVASRAKHGLIVAPGKIDPGFNPAPLVLVIFNQSPRVISLTVGEKVACLAIGELSSPAKATTSIGHALIGAGRDYEPKLWTRLSTRLLQVDGIALGKEILKGLLVGVGVLWVAFSCGLKK